MSDASAGGLEMRVLSVFSWVVPTLLITTAGGCGKSERGPDGDGVSAAATPPVEVEARVEAPSGPTCVATQRGDDAPSAFGASWDSAIDCPGAPDFGTFEAIVKIDNPGSGPLVVEKVELAQVVPGPLRRMVQSGRIAFTEAVAPLTVAAGGAGEVPIRMKYVLSADESQRKNANLKLMVFARAGEQQVMLPVNVHLRAETGPEPQGAGRPGGGDPRFEREPGDD